LTDIDDQGRSPGKDVHNGEHGNRRSRWTPRGQTLRITYDPEADAAYIQLARTIEGGGVDFTFACNPNEVDGMINLDFDSQGLLVGIEVLNARTKLPPEVLQDAVRPGG